MHNLEIVKQSIQMSLSNIKNNKLRSFLTMLGIVIGVASVIGLVTIVSSVTTSIMNQFSSLGAGVISITTPGSVLKRGLNESDIDQLSEIEGVAGISPSVSMTTTVVYNGTVYDNVSVSGENSVYFQRNSDTIAQGRTFNQAESTGYTNVMIVDSNFVTKILGGDSPIGKTVLLDGYTYKIIGVSQDSDSLMDQMSDTSNIDGSVIMPYKNVLRMSSMGYIGSIEVYIDTDADQDTVKEALSTALKQIYNNADNAFSIIDLSSLTSTMNSISNMLSLMLGGIAGISLLVGGIGIMNMMLVSVSERTREIGLRKALGAEPKRIQLQFLTESITLSLFGGLIGIILGEIIAIIGANVLNTTFTVSYTAIAVGAGFSIAVGIIFGWMPARRASRLNPIDALRSE